MKRKQMVTTLFAAAALALVSGVATLGAFEAKADGDGQAVFMHQSAAIRTEENSGIRFYGQISDETYEANPAEMGVKITFDYNGAQSAERAIDKATLYQKDGVWTYNVVISGLPTDAYNVDFTVQAYVQMTATEDKIYSTNTTTHSIAYVAGEAEKETPTENSFYDDIINVASQNFTLETDAMELKVGASKQLGYTGTKVSYATYESENEEIVTVSQDGTITAVSPGETNVNVTIGNTTKSCAVTVKAVEAQELGTFDVELNRGDEDNANTVLTTATVPEALSKKLANVKAGTLTQTIGTNEPLPLTYEAGTLTGLQAGESTIAFTDTNGQPYTAKVNVCTLILSEKDDVLLMTQILEANKVRTNGDPAGKVPTFTSGGYFVMSADIDYNATWNANAFLLYDNTTSYKENGFIGTFDGRGHTIKGMVFQGNSVTDSLTGKTLVGCGLFTAIGNEGVVKNLAITGCSGTGSGKGVFLGLAIRGTVENLSIKITTAGKTVQSAGILCATVTDSAHFENIIVDFSGCEPDFNGTYAGLLWANMGSNENNPLTVKGVYVIGERSTDENTMITLNTIWCGGETATEDKTQNERMLKAIKKNGDCAAYFWSVEDFAAGLETLSIKAGETSGYQKDSTETHNAWAYIESHFDATIWDLSNTDGLPVFYTQA